MASYGKPLSDQMLTAKHLRRASNMLLKDYLRDDLSSCSSSGFKSLPRRQCCTTVRFDLLEKDLQAKRNQLLRSSTSKRRSCSFKTASFTISALHKASRAVINAVKLLPFPSISATPSSSQEKKSKRRLLSKSLSRKVLSRSFWRKAVKEAEGSSEPRRWRSFREFLLEEGDKASDQNTESSNTNSVTLGSSSCGSGISASSSGSSRKSSGNSWVSSELTWEISRSSSGNSTENDVAVSKENTPHKSNPKTGEDSTDGCTIEKAMDWASEEKEQFSPVSVLDCPFGDDEDINSPLDSTCSGAEGRAVAAACKHKHTHKTRHFDCMASLKPLDLENRMAMFSETEDEPYKPLENEKSKADETAWRLVNEVESSLPTMSKAEKKLLFDLFNEETTETAEKEGNKIAEEWIGGGSREVNMGSEICIKEMDECGRWTNISEEEGPEVGMELELEVLTTLVNELVLELAS